MRNLPPIAGLIVWLALLIGFFSIIPSPSCRDGWGSSSIGQRGACSHHGGVVRHGELKLLAVVVSLGAGFVTALALEGMNERRRKERLRQTLIRPAPDAPIETIVAYAILVEASIEFMYKGREDFVPLPQTVTPQFLTTTSGPYGRLPTTSIVGRCHVADDKKWFELDRVSSLRLSDS